MRDHDRRSDELGETLDASVALSETAIQKPRSNDGREKRRLLERGSCLGRYIILSPLGMGAMGAVYAAYDPELDRRVALKVVHPGAEAQDASGRLVREAQAMARLSHPNVIQVFDVGTVDDDVYIAMELVDGRTLRQWLDSEERTWPAILEVFAQAGRGLAHAHAHGVVHRDFKPENCLIGSNDGRVRVIDFGIARHHGGAEAVAPIDAAELLRDTGHSPVALASAVRTHAGTLIGTPAYMSSEQLQGRGADAASDQFAFCVSLYEAIYEVRPFGGDNVLALMHEVVEGNVRPPPENVRVPAWLRNAIVRGLGRDREARHRSMDALLDALSPPRRRNAGMYLGAAVVAAIAAIAALLWLGGVTSNESVCRGAERHLGDVWDAERRRTVQRAFAATHAPWADDAFEQVAARLDERASGWTRMRTEACLATRVHKEQSEEVLELRMQCLDRRLRELKETVRVLGRSDTQTLASAHQLVDDLPNLERCADIARLRSEAGREPPPAIAQRSQRLRRRLVRLSAMTDAGQYERAQALADRLLDQARALDWPPIEAELRLRRARVLASTGRAADAQDDLFEAIRLARVGNDGALEAEAWIDLVFVSGSRLDEHREALRWAGFARAALETLGPDALLEGRLNYNEGLVHAAEGRFERALGAYARAESRYREVLGEHHWRVAVLYGARASILSQMGQGENAVVEHRRAVDAMGASLGATHPQVALLLNNLANALRRIGRLEEARTTYEEALRIKRVTLGERNPSIAVTLVNLALLEQRLGRYAQARELLLQAREMRRASVGEAHPSYANTLALDGSLALDEGRADQALELFRRVLTLTQARGEAVAVARTRNDVAWALVRVGRPEEAVEDAQVALDLFTREGVGHERVAYARTTLAFALVESGRAAEAANVIEPALEARVDEEVDSDAVALTRFAAGRALYESGLDAERGRELVVRARASFAEAGPPGRWGLAEAERWLAVHPVAVAAD